MEIIIQEQDLDRASSLEFSKTAKRVDKQKSRYNKSIVFVSGCLFFFLLTTAVTFVALGGDYQVFLRVQTDIDPLEEHVYSVAVSEKIHSIFADDLEDSLIGVDYLSGERMFESKFASEKSADIVFSFSWEGKDESLEIYKSYLVPVALLHSSLYRISSKELCNREILIENAAFSSIIVERFVDCDISLNVGSLTLEDTESIAFIDINSVTPELRILEWDDSYFFDDQITGGIEYSLVARGDLSAYAQQQLLKGLEEITERYNFDPTQLASINMTGVTALVGQLGLKTETIEDPAFPLTSLQDLLTSSDLTHISNETSFAANCGYEEGFKAFCSKWEYLDTLKAIGVDIVELTGNHNNDWGSQYNTQTIEKYNELGWDYFGGGLNSQDASKILYKEVNGNKIAFLGYNYYDTLYGGGAIAWGDSAGANSYSDEKLKADIETAKATGAIVIVDFQFQECYLYTVTPGPNMACYRPLPSPDQEGVFKMAIDLGADIVIGTQAHQPQTFEAYNDGIIFYGLGNLLFPQMAWIGGRQGIILTHYMYKDSYIQTHMTFTYTDEDLSMREMSDSESQNFIKTLTDARK